MGEDKVPKLTDKTIYAEWKRRVTVWQVSTSIPKQKQAATLITRMEGKPEQAAIQLDINDYTADDGVKKLVDELDKLFLPDSTQQVFNALDEFLEFKRPSDMAMEDFCREFHHKRKMAEQKSGNTDMFNDGVLGYFMLKNSNLDSSSVTLIRATVSKLTLESVEAALKRTFGLGSGTLESGGSSSMNMTIKQEVINHSSSTETDQSGYCSSNNPESNSLTSSDENDTYYYNKEKPAYRGKYRGGFNRGSSSSYRGSSNYRGGSNFRGGSSNRGSSSSRGSSSYRGGSGYRGGKGNKGPHKEHDTPNQTNSKIICFYCGEEGHKIVDCPQRKADRSKQYFQSFAHVQDEETFLCHKTYNGALLDSGASATVCGEQWMRKYEYSLTSSEQLKIQEESCHQVFRFGDSDPIICTTRKNIPIRICGDDIMLWTYIVKNDIPLLLSRTTMSKMGCQIDFKHDEIRLFGKTKKLLITDSGHMIIPFENRPTEKTKGMQPLAEHTEEPAAADVRKTKSTDQSSYVVDLEDSKKIADHMHKYFAHGSTNKIKEVIKDSSLPKKAEICKQLEMIEKSCDQCLKNKSRMIPPRRVALPAGKVFNERVAMDLKTLDSGDMILHLIDCVTRYAMAISVKSKGAGEILEKLFQVWISVFGRAGQFLTDNGGEFVNQEFNEMCAVFDIKVSTSPAESPFCNGLIERHNGILGKMIDSTRNDTGCSLETAISWAVNAKNMLTNVQGFSPNQLVFGYNPSSSSLLDDHLKLSALRTETSSKMVADMINARDTARRKFLEFENSSVIKRALTERVFAGRNKEYYNGDQVYFKREKSKTWNGPAVVIGQSDNIVVIKHGGLLYRVHPCKIVLKHEADQSINGELDVDGRDTLTRPSTARESDSDANYDSYSVASEVIRDISHDEELDRDQRPSEDQSQMGLSRTLHRNQSDDQRSSEDQSQMEELSSHQNQSDDQRSSENQSQRERQRPHHDAEESSLVQWKSVPTSAGKMKLKKDDVIRYRSGDSQDWTSGIVIGRAGKATGKNKNEFNVLTEGEDQSIPVKLDNISVEMQDTYHLVTDVNVKDPALIRAKDEEIKRFKEFEVFEEVKDQGQQSVTSRWVITSKGDGKYKARLVARGFQEELYQQSDAPTVNKISKRLMFTIAACRKWEVKSLDITSAFLQADEIDREIYVKPPIDIRRKGIVWRIKKPLYGLGDSARRWYLTLRDKLIESGCRISVLDQSLFRFYNDRNCLCGILVTHVDDILYAGNAQFQREVMRQVQSCFKVSRMNGKDFTYLGWSITQQDGYIAIDQQEYGNSIEPVAVNKQTSRDSERPLNDTEKTMYQETLGKLLWISSQTRPDLSYDTMELSTYTSSVKVKHLKILNKVVKKVSYGPKEIRYTPMDIDQGELQVVFYSDASLGNLPNKVHSGRGYLVFISDGRRASLVAWSSNKIKRVVHSVFGAETLGCVDGYSAAIHVRQLLSEILYDDPKKTVIPIIGYVDSNQLYQQVTSTKQCLDMRMRLDIAGIREVIRTGEVQSISWVPTRDMLADCLTKKNADCSKLKNVIERGKFF